jgi:hypothetical protein
VLDERRFALGGRAPEDPLVGIGDGEDPVVLAVASGEAYCWALTSR